MTDQVADLDAFYSSDDIALWKRIIGEDLHYHFGTFRWQEDLETGLKQTVRNFFPAIAHGARLLDLGCGWGGPAKLLRDEHGCAVSGITISAAQAQYCRGLGLDVACADLEDPSHPWPTGFDVVFSLEMISHIRDKAAFLARARECGARLVLSESCVADAYEGPRRTFGDAMQMCSVGELEAAVEAAGWRIVQRRNRRLQAMRTLTLWGENLDRTFGADTPPGHFAVLRSHVEAGTRDPKTWMRTFPLIDIVAE